MTQISHKGSETLAVPENVQKYVDASLSPATRRAYRTDWNAYTGWCATHGLDPLGDPLTVAKYLARLADELYSVSTIDRRLSAICKAWEVAGLDSPRSDRTVKFARKGILRTRKTRPVPVDAFRPSHIRAMVEHLPDGHSHRLRSARNRALLVLGFAGGFRRSELVGLDVEDVTEVEEGLRVTIRRSKTDQEGRGRDVGLPYGSVLATCPVRAWRNWLDVSGLQEGALFRAVSPDGRTLTPRRLSTRQLANVIKTAARKADIPGRYAGHSLRSGLVTAAVRAKKPLDAIRRQTGHSSMEMLMRYVRDEGIFDNNAAAGLL